MASDLHDDVTNTLNNIKIVAKEAALNHPTIAEQELESIQQMSGAAIEHLNDVIWAVDIKLNKVKNLVFVMEDYLDDVVRAERIPVEFQTNRLNLNRNLNMLYRRNILMIFKEAISNAVKHTRPTKIKVVLENNKYSFNMLIVNYFNQKKVRAPSTGKGINNMNKRAERINGKLIIEEKDDQFMVSLKLNNKI